VEIKFVTFDCYGTLIHFQMDRVIVETLGDRLGDAQRAGFLASCEAYRFDEVLGEYKAYKEVITSATRRAATRHHIDLHESDTERIYDAVPTWGPHPGVREALESLSQRYNLVILSNAADEQIGRNVEKLGAPFHAVITAQQASAYKPRLAAFEFMLDALRCSPDEIVHVSSSAMYDLRPAQDMGIGRRVLLNRGYEPPQPWLGYSEIAALSELAGVLEVQYA
jgi:2-haloacid dehalogenase